MSYKIRQAAEESTTKPKLTRRVCQLLVEKQISQEDLGIPDNLPVQEASRLLKKKIEELWESDGKY